jgi:hypothetical protein
MHDPVTYFMKYAFPCTYVLKEQGKISQAVFNRIEKATLASKPVPKEILEKTYINAFRRLKEVAKTMKKDYWDYEVIKEYFQNHHNNYIMDGDGGYKDAPEILKDLCKIHKGKIVDAHADFFVVSYDGGKTRVVANFLVPEAKKGDKVFIHHGFAVEPAD